MIYLIADSSSIKIGWSQNPTNRLHQLQTAQSQRLHLIKVWDCDRLYEKRIHHILRQFKSRHNGEWFNLSSEQATELINAIISPSSND